MAFISHHDSCFLSAVFILRHFGISISCQNNFNIRPPLWQMLSKDFLGLVIISCAIAIPVAWYFLHQWLQKYPYRTDISWWIFIIAGAGAMVITLLTVSYQAIKAALMNPISSLRTE